MLLMLYFALIGAYLPSATHRCILLASAAFLEISEGCCPLMIVVHAFTPPKVVLNTKRGTEEQGDCRSGGRNFALRLESQQDFGSRAQFESAAGEESGAGEGYPRV